MWLYFDINMTHKTCIMYNVHQSFLIGKSGFLPPDIPAHDSMAVWISGCQISERSIIWASWVESWDIVSYYKTMLLAKWTCLSSGLLKRRRQKKLYFLRLWTKLWVATDSLVWLNLMMLHHVLNWFHAQHCALCQKMEKCEKSPDLLCLGESSKG